MSPQKKLTFEEKILQSLSPLATKKVVIASSGGPDSMVLLTMLQHFYGESFQDFVTVAHIHHGLRESAERDQEIVQQYCEKYHLAYECLRVNIREESKKTKTTIEECARNIRKKWLEEIRKKHRADSILTAHHADDQVETLLYRITKGTGITGLVGIERFSGYYFRPLLEVQKKDILEHAQKNNLIYGNDETNEDTKIPRNLLRNEILPRLQSINPETGKSLERLSESARELREGFDTFFSENILRKEFDYDWYQTLPLGFQHELLRCFYESANGSTHGFSRALLSEIDRFLSTRTGGKKELGKKWLMKKQGVVYLT